MGWHFGIIFALPSYKGHTYTTVLEGFRRNNCMSGWVASCEMRGWILTVDPCRDSASRNVHGTVHLRVQLRIQVL